MLCWFNSFIFKGNTHTIEKQLNSLNYAHGKPLAPQSPREGSAICLVAIEGHGRQHQGEVNRVTGWKLSLQTQGKCHRFYGEETPRLILLCVWVLFLYLLEESIPVNKACKMPQRPRGTGVSMLSGTAPLQAESPWIPWNLQTVQPGEAGRSQSFSHL